MHFLLHLFLVSVITSAKSGMANTLATRTSIQITAAPTLPFFSHSTGPCEIECTVSYPSEESWEWQSQKITSNFTHATVVQIVNTARNTTRYSTIFNQLPANITVPHTNEEGTIITTTTFSNWPSGVFTTVIAFPTGYYDYGYSYQWNGINILTSSNRSSCATASASSSVITLRSHPPISNTAPYIWGQDYSNFESCTATMTNKDNSKDFNKCQEIILKGHEFPARGDKFGTNFVLVKHGSSGSFDRDDLFPEFEQFSNCEMSAAAGEGALQAVAFLTEKSVSYESDSSQEISTAPKPEQTPRKASSLPSQRPTTTAVEQNVHTIDNTQAPKAAPTFPTNTDTQTGISSRAEGTSKLAMVIASQTIVVDSDSQFVIFSKTLQSDSPITLGSGTATTVIALTTDEAKESLLVVGSSSSTLQRVNPAESPPPTLIIDSTSVTANSNSEYIIADQTLSQGGSVTLGSGKSESIINLKTDSASREVIVIGSSTSILRQVNPAGTSLPALVIGSSRITANSRSEFIISDQTLTQGGAITIGHGSSKTVVKLGKNSANSEVVIIGSSTSTLSVASPMYNVPLVVGSRTITENSRSQYIISGQTLIAGGAITIGTGKFASTLALTNDSSNQIVFVVGHSSSTLIAPTTSLSANSSVSMNSAATSDNVGGYIVSGLGITPATSLPGSSTSNSVSSTTSTSGTGGQRTVNFWFSVKFGFSLVLVLSVISQP